jgi:3'(2'), 5'-bisphosphate nucleotidase
LQTPDDHALAARIAEEAGRLLVALRGAPGGHGPGGARALGDEGDRRSHEHISAALAADRPADAVLSEEGVGGVVPGAGAVGRAPGARVWVVDPLDGTREYREGRTDFAVHVALVVDGVPVVGAVALPAEDLVLATGGARPRPAPAPRPAGPLRVAVSRTRPPAEAMVLEARLGARLLPMGSAGVKAMAVVRGEVDAYVHSGGQYEWDSAAPVAVARDHGVHASRLDGSPLVYDRPDPWLPDLLVCRPEVLDTIADALRH